MFSSNTLMKFYKREGLKAENEALKTIAREAAGSVRDALSILDQVLVNCETIIENQMVNELLGKVSKLKVLSLLELIMQGKTNEFLRELDPLLLEIPALHYCCRNYWNVCTL